MDDQSAILTIDLDALRHNWRVMAMRAGTAECGAVVKADAYGIGIEPAVTGLLKGGCRTFFVAHLSEGQRVRAVAPTATIYVLNGYVEARTPVYRSARLRPVLGTLEEIAAWKRLGAGCEPAALHIDTGMNRLGLRMDEALAFIGNVNLADYGIGLTMSHFASAEIEGAKDRQAQIDAFAAVQAKIMAPGSPNKEIGASLFNSSGHFIEGIASYALTRPGYALYGGNPTPGRPNPMRPVIRLEAPIIQINTVKKGEAVGYNGNWVAERDSRVATVSCGYADGLPRNLGNSREHRGGIALVAGRECGFAGNVSMDLITIDVTDVPEGAVRHGDMATLIGDALDIDRVGRSGKTIGYEVLTSLGKRYRRTFIG